LGHSEVRAVAGFGAFLQALQTEGLEVGVNAWMNRARRFWFPLGQQADRLERGSSLEGRLTRQQLVENRAQPVDVGGARDSLMGSLLWRHITGCAQEAAGLGQAAGIALGL